MTDLVKMLILYHQQSLTMYSTTGRCKRLIGFAGFEPASLDKVPKTMPGEDSVRVELALSHAFTQPRVNRQKGKFGYKSPVLRSLPSPLQPTTLVDHFRADRLPTRLRLSDLPKVSLSCSRWRYFECCLEQLQKLTILSVLRQSSRIVQSFAMASSQNRYPRAQYPGGDGGTDPGIGHLAPKIQCDACYDGKRDCVPSLVGLRTRQCQPCRDRKLQRCSWTRIKGMQADMNARSSSRMHAFQVCGPSPHHNQARPPQPRPEIVPPQAYSGTASAFTGLQIQNIWVNSNFQRSLPAGNAPCIPCPMHGLSTCVGTDANGRYICITPVSHEASCLRSIDTRRAS